MQKLLHNRYFLLWALCLLGSWAALPYVYYLGVIPPSVSMGRVFLQETIQSALLYGVLCWVSSKLIPKTDLNPFSITNLRKQILYPAIISGVTLGLLIYLLDKTIFQPSLLSVDHPPLWAGTLASIRGGVNEEVLLRLFFFTLIYFLFGRIFKSAAPNRSYLLWTTNILVALLFGIAHLPFLYKLVEPTSLEISRVLLLNGIAGLVFGWLYWSRGIWAAIIAHFITDLMIHAFLI